jgi:hypothetical protein
VRSVSLLLLCTASAWCISGGGEGYVIPGVETGEVLMNVHVWGEVVRPGTYQVPFDADLVAAISEAGGPGGEADLGGVRLVYEGIEIEYDLDDFLEGAGEPVPALRPGATIYIPRRSFEWWKEAIDIGYKVLVAVNLIWLMTER